MNVNTQTNDTKMEIKATQQIKKTMPTVSITKYELRFRSTASYDMLRRYTSTFVLPSIANAFS